MRYQKIKIFITTTFFAISILVVGGCRYDVLPNPPNSSPLNCATSPAKFRTDILPLVTSKCAIPGCHNTDASGGIVLQNYAEISAAKDTIYQRAVVEKSMPPTGPLQPAEIALLKCWIENGAKDN